MPKGTTLLCTAWWDNSEDNLSNPDPTLEVGWGDQTFEEMMIGFYVEVYPKDKMPKRASGRPQFNADAFFAQMDRNGTGELVKDELPGAFRSQFGDVDADNDGVVTKTEFSKYLERFGGGE